MNRISGVCMDIMSTPVVNFVDDCGVDFSSRSESVETAEETERISEQCVTTVSAQKPVMTNERSWFFRSVMRSSGGDS